MGVLNADAELPTPVSFRKGFTTIAVDRARVPGVAAEVDKAVRAASVAEQLNPSEMTLVTAPWCLSNCRSVVREGTSQTRIEVSAEADTRSSPSDEMDSAVMDCL
jgi:hypothetical protein